MTAFEERRAALMTYCRLDELTTDEEALLESCYEDAVGYMATAGVAEPMGGPRRAQYEQCVNALVLDAWDHRGTQTGDKALVDNPAFRRRMNQLKLSEPPVSAAEQWNGTAAGLAADARSDSDGGAVWS